MRKVLAVILTIVTLLAIKETIYVFGATDPEMVKTKSVMIVIWISITLPLILLTAWLWRPSRSKKQ